MKTGVLLVLNRRSLEPWNWLICIIHVDLLALQCHLSTHGKIDL